jgi:hypothetical protein
MCLYSFVLISLLLRSFGLRFFAAEIEESSTFRAMRIGTNKQLQGRQTGWFIAINSTHGVGRKSVPPRRDRRESHAHHRSSINTHLLKNIDKRHAWVAPSWIPMQRWSSQLDSST